MNIRKMMKQAQQMQEQLEREAAEMKIDATAGGGMVAVTMSGQKVLLDVRIDPECIDPEDPAMLQDLVLAAVNDATRKVDEHMKDKLGSLTGGMGMPGGLF